MNNSLTSRIAQFWTDLQHDLFPFLREEDHLALTPALEGLIRVLEFIGIERFIPSSRGFVGRPPKDRIALARAFVAKAVLNLPTTEALIDRLRVDRALRRICGFERFTQVPDAVAFLAGLCRIRRDGPAGTGARGVDLRSVGRPDHWTHRPGFDRDRGAGEARPQGTCGRTRRALRATQWDHGRCGACGRTPRACAGAGHQARAPAQGGGAAQGADRHRAAGEPKRGEEPCGPAHRL